MTTTAVSPSHEVRQRLDHPVIDSDGHMVEFPAPVEDYVRAIGGSSLGVRFDSWLKHTGGETNEERRRAGKPRTPWWTFPAKNTLDRATAAIPKLLHERLDEMGIDYTVLFSTMPTVQVYKLDAPHVTSINDQELRRIKARAVNTYRADICREYADRMTPAAEIPMYHPKAAMEELEYAVKKLGLKTAAIFSVLRPLDPSTGPDPSRAGGESKFSTRSAWLDTLGIDSLHDYDPFWAKCVELKVPVMSHGGSMGFTGRNSPSNYMNNHIGSFADIGEAISKSLFFGGVTLRFPSLKFAFLEGGVSTACRVYNDIVGHWKKRNKRDVHNYNPANLNREQFLDLHRRYGDERYQQHIGEVLTVGEGLYEDPGTASANVDDWTAARVESVEDIRDLFITNFYFGCEADDPMNAVAFNRKVNALGACPKAIFSPDISHWDVPDMREVLEHAYELVDHGIITPGDFRKFTFSHPLELFTAMNPDFFKGTVVEQAAAKELQTAKR